MPYLCGAVCECRKTGARACLNCCKIGTGKAIGPVPGDANPQDQPGAGRVCQGAGVLLSRCHDCAFSVWGLWLQVALASVKLAGHSLPQHAFRRQALARQAVTDSILSVGPQDYIDNRLKDQLDWYRTKAGQAKQRHTLLASVQFATTAAVPVLNAFGAQDHAYIYAASISAAIAAISMGFLALGNHQQNWLRYRQAANSLETIFWLYKNGARPFDTAERDRRLVEHAEDVMAQESGQWRSELAKGSSTTPLRPV